MPDPKALSWRSRTRLKVILLCSLAHIAVLVPPLVYHAKWEHQTACAKADVVTIAAIVGVVAVCVAVSTALSLLCLFRQKHKSRFINGLGSWSFGGFIVDIVVLAIAWRVTANCKDNSSVHGVEVVFIISTAAASLAALGLLGLYLHSKRQRPARYNSDIQQLHGFRPSISPVQTLQLRSDNVVTRQEFAGTNVFICHSSGDWATIAVENLRHRHIALVQFHVQEVANVSIHVLHGVQSGDSCMMVVPPGHRYFALQCGPLDPTLPASNWVLSCSLSWHRPDEESEKLLQRDANAANILCEKSPKVLMAQDLCSRAKAAQALFYDLDFPPEQSSILPAGSSSAGVHKTWLDHIVWHRPEQIAQILGLQDLPLFVASGQELSPLLPGCLGDAMFVTCVAALAAFPARMRRCFPSSAQALVPDGLVQLRFCKDGWWKDLYVDSFLPCILHGGLCFLGNQQAELWAAFIQKGHAKLHRSYYSLRHAVPGPLLADLTGFPSFTLPLLPLREVTSRSAPYLAAPPPVPQTGRGAAGWHTVVGIDRIADLTQLWACLQRFHEREYILVAATPPAELVGKKWNKQAHMAFHFHGLEVGRVYSVVALEITPEGQRRIALSNPWPREPWQQQWDVSATVSEPQWTAGPGALVLGKAATKGDPGTIMPMKKRAGEDRLWLSLDAFVQSFTEVVACLYDQRLRHDIRVQGMLVQIQANPMCESVFHQADAPSSASQTAPLPPPINCLTTGVKAAYFMFELFVQRDVDLLFCVHQHKAKEYQRAGVYVLQWAGENTDVFPQTPSSTTSFSSAKQSEEGLGYELMYWSGFSNEKEIWVQMRLTSSTQPYLVLPVSEAGFELPDTPVIREKDRKGKEKEDSKEKEKEKKPPSVVLSLQSSERVDVTVTRIPGDLLAKCWVLSANPHPPARQSAGAPGVVLHHLPQSTTAVAFVAVNESSDTQLSVLFDFSESYGYVVDTNADHTVPKSPLAVFNYDVDYTDNDVFTHTGLVFRADLPPRSVRYVCTLHATPAAGADARWVYRVTTLAAERVAHPSRHVAPLSLVVDPIVLRPLPSQIQINGRQLLAEP